MKKNILFLAGAWLILLSANGQTSQMDTAYAQYLGKYLFPPGAPVENVQILWSDSLLSINSVMGSTPLQRVSKDSFKMVLFGGAVVFKRSPQNKVSGVKVYINDLILDGTREGSASFLETLTPGLFCSRGRILVGRKRQTEI